MNQCRPGNQLRFLHRLPALARRPPLPRTTISPWRGVAWQTPAWLGVYLLVGGTAWLILLVNGPRPWRATRWARFWLVPRI